MGWKTLRACSGGLLDLNESRVFFVDRWFDAELISSRRALRNAADADMGFAGLIYR
jgi:hypothetical protein